jgi:beta-glucosidase
MHRWFLDPIFRGSYPEDVLQHLGDLTPKTEPGDAEIIARPIDFLGANYYTHMVVQQTGDAIDTFTTLPVKGAEYTAMDWEVYPRGIYDVLLRLHREYAVPEIYIVENGAAFPDTMEEDGSILDPRRINYLHEHLLQVHAALDEGVPLKGYSVWALLDNFEWSLGYSMRFGIVHVDYATQKRTLKASGAWYREVIANNSVV